MVGWNDEPGCVLAGRRANCVFVTLLILVPEIAFAEVALADLVLLLLIVATRLQPGGLFLVTDVQEDLENGYTAGREHLLELIDLAEALLGCFVGDHFVPARHEHVLIVRAVEDTDAAMPGHRRVGSP